MSSHDSSCSDEPSATRVGLGLGTDRDAAAEELHRHPHLALVFVQLLERGAVDVEALARHHAQAQLALALVEHRHHAACRRPTPEVARQIAASSASRRRRSSADSLPSKSAMARLVRAATSSRSRSSVSDGGQRDVSTSVSGISVDAVAQQRLNVLVGADRLGAVEQKLLPAEHLEHPRRHILGSRRWRPRCGGALAPSAGAANAIASRSTSRTGWRAATAQRLGQHRRDVHFDGELGGQSAAAARRRCSPAPRRRARRRRRTPPAPAADDSAGGAARATSACESSAASQPCGPRGASGRSR
jgi:hypothetical protein